MTQHLEAQYEPPHVQVTEQRTDRSALRRPSPFVLVPRRSMAVPPLVDLLDGRFQPHLQQMQHRAVHDATCQALHQFGVGNTVEIPAQVRIHHLRIPTVQQVSHMVDRV